MNTFNQLLTEKRKAKGLTQQMLARRIGMTAVQLCKIEKGHCSPTLDTVGRIADALEVSLAELLSVGDVESNDLSEAGLNDTSWNRFTCIRYKDSNSVDDTKILTEIISVENKLCELEARLKIPHATLLPLIYSFKLDACDAQTVARYMRSACAVGAATFSDLVELLEFRNVRFHTILLPEGVQSRSYVDNENNSISIVLAATNTPERNVYRIAYELAWVIISGAQGFKPVREGEARHRFARAFASEFLMPEESIRFTVSQLGIKPNDWTFAMIIWLKSKFNVSAEAFALRLESLGLISKFLRQKIRDEIREYYKLNPKSKEPPPHLSPLKIGTRLKLLEASVVGKREEAVL